MTIDKVKNFLIDIAAFFLIVVLLRWIVDAPTWGAVGFSYVILELWGIGEKL